MRLVLASAAAVVAVLCAAGAGVASAAATGMGMYSGGNALPWVSSHVEIDVELGLARGEVRQTFRNNTGKIAEAVYVFPLPTGAAVTAMRITVGGRTIDAAIAPRAAAAKRYEDAVASGRAAALTEHERPGVYTQSVAGIPIDGVIEISLDWQARLDRHGGVWELAHPMVIGPRYVPGTATGAPTRGGGWSPDTNRAPDASRVTPPVAAGAKNPWTFVVRVDGAGKLESPSHELIARAGAHEVRDPRGDRELIVRWSSGAQSGVRAVAEPAGAGAYVAVLIEAAPAPARPRRAARTWLVAVDRARSLEGVGAAQARRMAQTLLDQMRADDRFALVAIGQTPRFAKATPADRTRALAAFDRASGTDDLTVGLATTLRGLPPATTVVLLTDGLVADDAAAIAAAIAARVPIHPVGVGAAPNRWLLEAIAARTGGVAHVVTGPDDVATVAAELVTADQARPFSVDWRKPTVEDAEPSRAVVLPGGATLVVAVDRKSVPTGEVEVVLGGVRLRAPIERRTGTRLATEWARLRVGRLWAGGDAGAATALAVERGIVGPTTALVAVAPDAGETVRSTVTVPLPAPAGLRREARKRADKAETRDAPAPAPKPDSRQVVAPAPPPAPAPAPAREPSVADEAPAAGAGAGEEEEYEAVDQATPRHAIATTESISGRPLGRRYASLGVHLGARLDDPGPAAIVALGLHQRVTPRLIGALRVDLTAAPTATDPVTGAAMFDVGLRMLDRLMLDLGAGLGWGGDLGFAYRGGVTVGFGRFGVGLNLTGVRSSDQHQATAGAGIEAHF